MKNYEILFNLLIEKNPNAIVIYEPIDNGQDFKIIVFNEAAEKIEKISRNVVLGKKLTDVFPGIKKFGIFQVFQRVTETNQGEYFPTGLYEDNREKGWRENYIFPTPDGEIVAIYNDKTIEKQKDAEIVAMAKFPEENPNPVLRCNYKGKILFINHAGRPLLKHWNTQSYQIPDYINNFIQNAINEKKPITFEFDIDQIIYQITAIPIFDKEYVNLYFTNITNFKNVEAQLRQAQKMEAIGQLAGGVAHDFNNLLTVILGGVTSIIENPNNVDNKLLLSEIQIASKKAVELCSSLLSISRKQILQQKKFNINNLFNNLLILIKRIIGANISVITNFEEKLWDIDADLHQIEQVILNLTINSRDAMPNGGTLIFETSNETYSEPIISSKLKNDIIKPGDYVLLKISDSGCGMDENTFNHLFEPFFTTKPLDKGTGLGLSTSYGIIKQHNGYIIPYSELGKGTTFKIYLPKSNNISANTVKVQIETSVDSNIASEKLTNNLKVFVVEDDLLVRQFMKIVLKNAGYYVIDAESSEKCLELLENEISMTKIGSNKYFQLLLITDIMLPKMLGSQLALIIKEKYPNSKFLFISGYSEKMVLTNGYLSGEKPFLSKPFTPNDLLKKIEEIIRG